MANHTTFSSSTKKSPKNKKSGNHSNRSFCTENLTDKTRNIMLSSSIPIKYQHEYIEEEKLHLFQSAKAEIQEKRLVSPL